MDKAQAIQSFWGSFGLPAFDENTAADTQLNIPFPHITYTVSTGNIGNPLLLSADLWYKSTSWAEISQKADEIAEFIGYGHVALPIRDGYMYITQGSPFAQRMGDDNDNIRRIHINITAEFLTAH